MAWLLAVSPALEMEFSAPVAEEPWVREPSVEAEAQILVLRAALPSAGEADQPWVAGMAEQVGRPLAQEVAEPAAMQEEAPSAWEAEQPWVAGEPPSVAEVEAPWEVAGERPSAQGSAPPWEEVAARLWAAQATGRPSEEPSFLALSSSSLLP